MRGKQPPAKTISGVVEEGIEYRSWYGYSKDGKIKPGSAAPLISKPIIPFIAGEGEPEYW
jgi:hypothetical protein